MVKTAAKSREERKHYERTLVWRFLGTLSRTPTQLRNSLPPWVPLGPPVDNIITAKEIKESEVKLNLST